MKGLALAGLASLLVTSIPVEAIPLTDSLELTLTAEAASTSAAGPPTSTSATT